MALNFDPLFKPATVAVVGVSQTNERHPANVIFHKLLLRYPVTVYGVNPKGGHIQREKIYRTLSDIPTDVDHAVIAVRAEGVPDVIEACIAKGVGGATIVSGGFAESGRQDLQDRVTALAAEAGLPVIGPNCLGIYVPRKFDTFFLPGERLVRPEAGNVALISQSGGVLVDQLVKFAGQGIGVSLAVSIGNKALIRETDLLRYLATDAPSEVLAFYIEGFGPNEGRDFVQTAANIGKPVVVLKAGKSASGSRAVASHTASLAGDYNVFSQVLAQHGIAEAKNEYELISFCEALSRYRHTISGKVGIITVSGGHGALAVDACRQQGLEVPILSESVQNHLRDALGPSIRGIASLENPIDLTGSAADDDFIAAVNILSEVQAVDCVLVLLLPYSPGVSSDLGARLGQIYQKKGTPLVAYVPHVEKYRILIEGFELNRVPVSDAIDGAVLMVEALRRWQPC
ncbi:MAG: CoA-binding protein [Desulfobacteraceae bacterium]